MMVVSWDGHVPGGMLVDTLVGDLGGVFRLRRLPPVHEMLQVSLLHLNAAENLALRNSDPLRQRHFYHADTAGLYLS